MSGTTPFLLDGPLPVGDRTTVLEASAGTGKTHAIASLAGRFVADGTPLDRLLLITFGRAATTELRERVRERLIGLAAALEGPDAVSDDDPVVRLLATGDRALVEVRVTRLREALARFDATTIATTHGFCSQMLRVLGTTADVDHDARIAENLSDLVEETTNDLYIRAFGQGEGAPSFSAALAGRITAAAVSDRSALLGPLEAPEGSVAARRRRLAEVAREEVRRRKQLGRLQDYDDLLGHLRDAVKDPVVGRPATARIRDRFDVVMVDEFQDTDPVQWEILEHVFHGHRTMVLIGDPKQAIYAFRGADVQTYLDASRQAHDHRTLATNYRADEALVRALEPLLGGVSLGDPRIRVGPVSASRAGSRLPARPPVRIRLVDRTTVPPGPGKKNPTAGQVQPYVARDVAADIVRLLQDAPELPTGPVRPGDIAVLVQTGYQAGLVRDAIAARGVPVVQTGTTSVFASPAAQDWLTLLLALEQPHRTPLVRAAAMTVFCGWRAVDLDGADETRLDEHAARLRSWSEILRRDGVAALVQATATATSLHPRVLGVEGGERVITDVRHIGHLLHQEVGRRGSGAGSLIAWLHQRIADAADDADRERSRRLESDDLAVQVTTVHTSKGLEYPIVYAPYLWWRVEAWGGEEILLYHDEQGRRVRDVGGADAPGGAERARRHDQEAVDEALRLAYVALTRASSQVVLWWAPTWHTRRAPLHRLLLGSRDAEGCVPLVVDVPSDEVAQSRIEERLAPVQALVSVENATHDGDGRWRSPDVGPRAGILRTLGRALDTDWVRTSYSGLTAGLHEHTPRVTSEVEAPGTVDEPDLPDAGTSRVGGAPVAPPAAPLAAPVSPMTGLPTGAAFGTLVHEVIEHTDFTAPHLLDELTRAAAAAGSARLAGVPAEELAAALHPSLTTPLGPLAGGRRLADISSADVLAEMEYELPLAGAAGAAGGGTRRAATVDDIGDLLARRLDQHDPLRPYADDLRVEGLRGRPLKGFIGGFVDAVLRVRDDDGTPRYLVVDYKTNWLGSSGEVLTADAYRPDALVAAMRHAHYPLQALLYTVALHRYLRWRQPGYDPGMHLGGTLYLFLRGMCGPETPQVDGVPAGVFSWRPPAQLIVDLSDLLDGVGR